MFTVCTVNYSIKAVLNCAIYTKLNVSFFILKNINKIRDLMLHLIYVMFSFSSFFFFKKAYYSISYQALNVFSMLSSLSNVLFIVLFLSLFPDLSWYYPIRHQTSQEDEVQDSVLLACAAHAL